MYKLRLTSEKGEKAYENGVSIRTKISKSLDTEDERLYTLQNSNYNKFKSIYHDDRPMLSPKVRVMEVVGR